MSKPNAVSRVRIVQTDASNAVNILGISVFPLVSNRESDDQFGMFKVLVPPGAGIPPHTHPDVELFYVLDGELNIMLDGGSFKAGKNQGGFVPSNALHGFLNEGAAAADVLVTCTSGLEDFLLAAGIPLADAQPGPPSPDEVARVLGIAAKFGQQFPAA